MERRRSRAVKTLWTVICVFAAGICGVWMMLDAGERPEASARLVKSVSVEKEPVKTSAAFYSLIGYSQKITPDLRGNFWEWQLPDYPIDADLVYLSDGPC